MVFTHNLNKKKKKIRQHKPGFFIVITANNDDNDALTHLARASTAKFKPGLRFTTNTLANTRSAQSPNKCLSQATKVGENSTN